MEKIGSELRIVYDRLQIMQHWADDEVRRAEFFRMAHRCAAWRRANADHAIRCG